MFIDWTIVPPSSNRSSVSPAELSLKGACHVPPASFLSRPDANTMTYSPLCMTCSGKVKRMLREVLSVSNQPVMSTGDEDALYSSIQSGHAPVSS